jgi:hypothetical protein
MNDAEPSGSVATVLIVFLLVGSCRVIFIIHKLRSVFNRPSYLRLVRF